MPTWSGSPGRTRLASGSPSASRGRRSSCGGGTREAQRRFGVPWNVLAAVNFVESGFGKLRNDSVAGAQGPMQFMPATWRAYGLGGNVHDAHDAIVGAANYLHANGAPAQTRNALYHYNPSPLYVDAVMRYARRIARGRNAFLAYYSWPVFVRTTAGVKRVTGPRQSPASYLNEIPRRTRYSLTLPSSIVTSKRVASATRRSRIDFAAVSTALLAAFAQDSLLVPITSVTRYTLLLMLAPLVGVAPYLRSRHASRPRRQAARTPRRGPLRSSPWA